jgi:diacylglycerol kinase (ATP)
MKGARCPLAPFLFGQTNAIMKVEIMGKGRDTSSPLIVSLLHSFGYAVQGVAFSIRTERSAQFHLLGIALVGSAGVWLKVSPGDWRWLMLCIAMVWFAELINTAFEYLCDLVMPDIHESVKRAKDIAAGAVLACVAAAVGISLLTFWPYVKPLLAE